VRQVDPDLDFSVERIVALPGTRTNTDSWIIQTLIAAWEAQEGKAHEPIGKGSGASDAAILRSSGIDTARIGLPMPATPSPFSGFSMGVADEESMCRLALLLVHPLVETASRSRSAVGLD